MLHGLLLGGQTDERLCALVSRGDERAFAVLADRHRAELIRAAVRAGAGDGAEDAVQDALLNAWKALRDGAAVRHPRAWLHQIVRHAAITQVRRHPGAEPLGEELAAPGAVADQLANRDLARDVLSEIASLPERQREALIATEFTPQSRREIAAELGVSEGAVRQLVYRARDSVRMAFSAVVPLPLVLWLLRPHSGPAERLTRALARANGSSFTQAVISQRGGGSLVRGGAVLLAAGAAGTFALPHLVGHNAPPQGGSIPRSAPGLTTSSGSGALRVLPGGDGLPAAAGGVRSSGPVSLLAGGVPELETPELEGGALAGSGTDLLKTAAHSAEPRDPSERAAVSGASSGQSHAAAPAGSDTSAAVPLSRTVAPADSGSAAPGSDSSTPTTASDSTSGAARGSADATSVSGSDGSSSQNDSSQAGTGTTSSSDN